VRNFLQSPNTSSFVYPDIFLNVISHTQTAFFPKNYVANFTPIPIQKPVYTQLRARTWQNSTSFCFCSAE